MDLMDLGMLALVGRAPGLHVGAESAPAAPPALVPAPAPSPPALAPAPAPKVVEPWATEPTPIKAVDLRDQLFMASAYAMLFGVGMGALTDEKVAAIGLVKTSMVLAIPAAVIAFSVDK